MIELPDDVDEQHADFVEECRRLYPELSIEEIEEFLRAHGY